MGKERLNAEARKRAKDNEWAREYREKRERQEAGAIAKHNREIGRRRAKGERPEVPDLGQTIAEEVCNLVLAAPLGALMDSLSDGIPDWEKGRGHRQGSRTETLNKQVAPDAMRKAQETQGEE